MAVKKNTSPNSTKKIRRKKPLIRRIKLGRLFLVLLLGSGIVYGAYVALSEVYNFASLKYAQYREENPSKPVKPPIAPQIIDKRFENYTNILLIGIDDQPVEGIGESGRYADALMLISMDHTSGQVRFLALPRNIKTVIAGRKEPDYLSFTYYYGGSPLTVNTVSQLLNIPITHYIALDRKALSKFVDTIGGVNIYVERDMNYEDPAGGTSIHLKKGYQHLTGDMSQQYLRFRTDDLGDIGRVHRQQKFAEALLEKLISIETLPALPTIITIFNDNLDTNINLIDISSIIDIMDTLYTNKFEIQMLPGNFGSGGDWIPDKARVEQAINEMFPLVSEETAQ
ncbi:MAG TPA: LCP family protein [Candidatus Megamonas gallistercoris]|nr:LCP family protein [Candidatus Megamonas gallistercoris]